jgi:hypothetical protein
MPKMAVRIVIKLLAQNLLFRNPIRLIDYRVNNLKQLKAREKFLPCNTPQR